jgi:anti-anti-sigma factor
MTNAMCEPMTNLMMTAAEPAERSELLRDRVGSLLERIGPLVLQRNVALDLTCVDRIDAAGITALVVLYQNARQAGHRFRVTHVPARVAQILTMVGLDPFLVSHNAVRSSQYGQSLQRPAA